MYQITDGTFADRAPVLRARHRVVEEGPWYDFKSCWLNELYTRTVPSHAVEMTAAYLDRGVDGTARRALPALRATLRAEADARDDDASVRCRRRRPRTRGAGLRWRRGSAAARTTRAATSRRVHEHAAAYSRALDAAG